ncbi:MAG TPA: hypothetical protein VMF09_14680 [Solirubrobacteraceae bacterium]|nr:hypothetical protein [Solirubrobacteraceae bacterium]
MSTQESLVPLKRAGVRAALASLTCVLAFASSAAAQSTTEAAWWQVESRVAPRSLAPGGEGRIAAIATDLGDAGVLGTTEKPVVVVDVVPAGLKVTSADMEDGSTTHKQLSPCTSKEAGGGATTVECAFDGTLEPYEELEAQIQVTVEPGAPASGPPNHVEVRGGDGVAGADRTTPTGEPTAKTAEEEIPVDGAPVPFAVERYQLSPEGEKGEPDTVAGSHPFQLTTTLDLDQTFEPTPHKGVTGKFPALPAEPRNLEFLLPPGLLGNTTAIPQCSGVDFSTLLEKNTDFCKPETAIGVAVVTFNEPITEAEGATEDVPVFNLVPAEGEPARLGFLVDRVPVYLTTEVLTGSDYAVRVSSHNISTAAQLLRSVVTVWGEPGDPRHDRSRGWGCVTDGTHAREGETCEQPANLATSPYLRMPTSCEKLPDTTVTGESWPVGQGRVGIPLPGLHEEEEKPTETLTGCGELPFALSASVLPEETAASTPTGLNVNVEVPQEATLKPEGKSEADVRESKVALPEGVTADAGAANALETCSAETMGFNLPGNPGFKAEASESEQSSNEDFSANLPGCANASAIGTVNIKTPLLPEELVGSVYMAAQNTDPFASPLALYVVAQAPLSKVLVKLAGEVSVSQETGQLVSTFKDTPDTPFERLQLHLFGGARASQATPSFCRIYTTQTSFKSWANQTVEQPSSFATTPNPDGQPCPARGPLPFNPSFEAGSNHQGGAFTPFTLAIKRPDGDQALKSITMETPPGLAAVIASVPLCGEPQAANGDCGEESLIGTSSTSSGLGSAPYTFPGKVYLTGPYDGAPFGLSSVTEVETETNGKKVFKVGRAVVRSAISVNPTTAAAIIDTNATTFFPKPGVEEHFAGLPEKIKGVPSQIKELRVEINRPNFEFNPTNCGGGLETTGTLGGNEGAQDGVSSPFGVDDCTGLPFKPKLTASAAAQGSKADGTTFKVTIESPGLGQANVHKVDLTLPEALPSRQSTLEKACLAATFEANPASCDADSMIGEGIAYTPVFKNPLRGPAYLVSHGAAAFPDVEFVLQGEGVTIVIDGKTDIKKGITYSKFETAPDAPFTKFESIFPAGPHSIVTPFVPEKENYNLCKHKLTIPTEITGQNGAFISQVTPVSLIGCGGVKSYKLEKALKKCKKDKNKRKRLACEKAARKKYGPHTKKTSKKHKKKSSKKK